MCHGSATIKLYGKWYISVIRGDITMKTLRKAVVTSLGILPFLGPVDAIRAESVTPESKDDLISSVQEMPLSKSRFTLEAQSGSRSIGTLDVMVPFMGDDDFMVYANAMAKLGTGAENSNGNTFEGNLGVGFRRVNDSETAIYGAYAFYDYLNSVNDNTFHQLTFGAERLGLTWDYRANVYLPIGEKEKTRTLYDQGRLVINNRNLIEYLKSSTEKVTAGGDIEVGRTLGTNKLRGYLAAYTFGKDLTGPRARLEYKLNQNFTLTGTVQYDTDRGTQYLLGARFNIGGAKAANPNSIYNRMTAPVIRDVDIVTKEKSVDFTRVEYDKFWMVDLDSGEGGDGTLNNPYGYVDEAIEAAPEGALIFIKGQNGEIKQLKDRLDLKEGQTIWGGSNAVYWDFENRSFTPHKAGASKLVHEADGARQSFGGTVNMADNSGIYGIDIIADGHQQDNHGIVINNKRNVTVYDVDISGFKAASDLHSADNVPYSAVYISGNSQDVTLDNVRMSGNDYGVYQTGGNTTINNSVISNSTEYGIYQTGGTTNINGSTISDNKNGIMVQGSASRLNLNGSMISKNDQHGLQITESATANVNSSTFDSNGLEYVDDATQLSRLPSAIQVDGTLNATRLYVTNNAAGIELLGGLLSINQGAYSYGDRSKIDGNSGYGIWSHSATPDEATNTLHIYNADITNTKSLDGGILSGHGIFAEHNRSMKFVNLNIANNDGTGLWIRSGETESGSGLITIRNNGSEVAERDTLDDLYYGMRVDYIAGVKTNVSFTNLKILDSKYHGLLVRNATVNLDTFESKNNEDGVLLTEGDLTITNGDIAFNKRFGIYVKNYYYGDESDGKNRTLVLRNTSVTYTQSEGDNDSRPYYEKTGHGLAVDHDADVTAYNSHFDHNDGYGIWMKTGHVKIHGDYVSYDDGFNPANYNSSVSFNKLGGVKGDSTGPASKGNLEMYYVAVTNNQNTGIDFSRGGVSGGGLWLDSLLVSNNLGMGLNLYMQEGLNPDATVKGTIVIDNGATSKMNMYLNRDNSNYFEDVEYRD